MITAVAQTLADLLTSGSALLSTVQVDLSHPSKRLDIRPALSLYLYDLRKSLKGDESSPIPRDNKIEDEHTPTQIESTVFWFDLSFVIIPWDWTSLGQQRLLSEVLQLLLSYPTIGEGQLAPELQGYGDLPIRVATCIPDLAAFWSAMKIPLQPALYITVTTPFPCIFESHFSQCLDKPYLNSRPDDEE